MLKQKLKNSGRIKHFLGAVIVGTVFSASVFVGAVVRADQFDAQIQSLQQDNAAKRAASNQLAAQASSYQGEVDRLSTQINSIRQAILDNQHQSDDIQKQIDADQVELDHQKSVLGQNIKAMYLEGQISTLEILASSKDLSEFVDKQQYRNSVQTKVKTTVDKITELKLQLQVKQREIQGLIKDQQAQQAQLDASLSQQSDLLNLTASQKAAKDSEIRSNQSKIADLRRQQAILNSQYNIGSLKSSLCGGGYPSSVPNRVGAYWGCSYSKDNTIDNWGMLNRECVSYTAFKVHEDYLAGKNSRDMPNWGGIGNAEQWDDNATAAGIPVDTNPTPGSIAIRNGNPNLYGDVGHSMYVEAVSGNTIYVSQYNSGWDGQYSETWRTTNGLVFIHF